MAYNSAYTGQQIDAAVGAVTQKESTWDDKQDALSGTEDQIVGFNSAGNATPIPKPIDLPEGGTTGQMLYKGESGIEWGNKPIMVVTVTSQTGGYVADKTAPELYEAYQAGYEIVVQANAGGMTSVILHLSTFLEQDSIYVFIFTNLTADNPINVSIAYNPELDETMVYSDQLTLDANYVRVMPPVLEKDNTQDVLEALAAKADEKPTFYVTISEGSSGPIADKTFAEISEAYESGRVIFAVAGNQFIPADAYIPGTGITFNTITFINRSGVGMANPFASTLGITADNSVEVKNGDLKTDAENVIFSPGATGLTSTDVQGAIAELAGKSSGAPKYATVTLSVSAWSNNAQTVTVPGILADETAQLIQPMPAMASQSAYYGAGVLCSGQAANSLTFTCQTVPTADLTVYIVMQEVGA